MGLSPDSAPVLCKIIKPSKGLEVTREQPFSAHTFNFSLKDSTRVMKGHHGRGWLKQMGPPKE